MSTLRERNEKLIKRMLIENEEVKALRDSMMKKYGVDPITDEKQFPFKEGRVKFSAIRRTLEEADVSGGFSQFLRAGLQAVTNGMYEATKVTYTDWVHVISSNKDTEIYAPNHGVAFPSEVPAGGLYPEVGVAALDLELKNKKFGNMYALQKELLNDDQSGTFAQQAGLMGEYMAILSEVLCYAKLASVSGMQYIQYAIPTSETKPSYESAYPWSIAFRGGGSNRPSTFGALGQSSIQAGIVGLMNQKNLQGIKMQVNPKRLIIGPSQRFDAAVLLNSGFYPSGAAAAGATGGALAINPIEGILDLTVSRFVFKQDGTVNGDSKAWFIVDDSKPFFVLQQREPVSITQEDPNSGESFNRDIVRFKASARMNADFLDPRFAWQGNDGSV
jgi:hypothetical protein